MRRKRTRRATLGALVVLMVLMPWSAAAFGVQEPASGPAEIETPAETEIETDRAVLDELQAFVSEVRGHPWLESVEVSILSPEVFDQRHNLTSLGGPDSVWSTLQALGLRPTNVEAAEANAGLVVGVYSTWDGSIEVRGTELGPLTRSILVHELTHALDDQWFGLSGWDLSAEPVSGTDSVIEGNARRVERLYVDGLGEAEAERYIIERAMLEAEIGPRDQVLRSLVLFPYEEGSHFITALAAAGGEAAVDAALVDPPQSSEQVLVPQRYAEADLPTPIDAMQSPPGAQVVDRGSLGAHLLGMMMGPTEASVAQRSLLGQWEGDSYVTWSRGRTLCTQAAVLTENGRAAELMRGAIARGLRDHPNALIVAAGDWVHLLACAAR